MKKYIKPLLSVNEFMMGADVLALSNPNGSTDWSNDDWNSIL